MRPLPRLAALPLLLALTACPGQTPTQTAATSVSGLAIALTAADQVMLKYATQPACKGGVTAWTCSNAATVARMKADAKTAYNAVKAAEADVTLLAAAQAAVSAVQADLPPS